jgi:hypothetical protein
MATYALGGGEDKNKNPVPTSKNYTLIRMAKTQFCNCDSITLFINGYENNE